MPFPEEEKRSPCHDCVHREEDKKKYYDCISCEKRLGRAARKFKSGESRSETKSPKSYKQLKPTKPCEWPHGCNRFSVKSRFCYEHQQIVHNRKRQLKNKGMSEEVLDMFVHRPVEKGQYKDSSESIGKFRKSIAGMRDEK